MKNKNSKIAILSSLVVLLAIHLVSAGFLNSQEPPRKQTQDNNVAMGRAVNIYQSVLAGVNALYVDTINMQAITTKGINAMLAQLDPYTEYISDNKSDDFAFMTTGEYGGIGAYIQQKDSAVYVQTPMPGTPAEKSGLHMGDRFVTIDGKSVVPGTASMVSGLLKGPVGTHVKVTIRRLGEQQDREVTLAREKVVVDQVVHRGLYNDSIGYIRLSSFTDKSADDVRRAYEAIAKSGRMRSLILDLRSNGGGVMDDAIKILSMFIPAKTMVLYTKGKLPQTSQKYYTFGNTLNTQIPIVVLINGGSASASEIVAGTIQDLDRGVLIGSKSFGKGLVQSTRALPYNGMLKVTIARYYIPSGRCIQQLDYSHRNPDGSVGVVPDSLTKVFHTRLGREVRDGGGIRPDVEVKDETMGALVYSMVREGYLFDYSNKLFLQRKAPQKMSDITITDEDFNGLIEYLAKSNFKYGDMTLKGLDELQKLAEFEGYKEQSKEAFEALKKVLTPALQRDIAPYKEQVKQLLKGMLASHYYGMAGQYAVGLESDPTFKEAVKVLSTPAEYRKYLTPKVKDNGKAA